MAECATVGDVIEALSKLDRTAVVMVSVTLKDGTIVTSSPDDMVVVEESGDDVVIGGID